MTILHITTGANYNVTKNYIRFINDNFKQNEHIFLVIDEVDNIPAELFKYKNVLMIDRSKKKYRSELYKYMTMAQKIIFHSLWLDAYYLLFLLFKPSIMNRIFWVAWGMDLYQWRSSKRGIHYKVRNLIAYKFRQRIKHFVGIFPPDIEFFKEEFKSQAKTYYASYVGGLYNPLYKKELNLISLSKKQDNNDCINIQIGHSSTRILKHNEVLEDLVKFKDENIKIYIPLSYGDKEYGDQVEEKAKILFGDKTICIREMMDKEDYMDFLATIDIAIFNTPRQIGLGNIYPLLYLEKKIFIPAGSVMYRYFNSLDINICDYIKLKKMNYYSFIYPVDMAKGKEYVQSNSINKNKKIEMWNKVFNK